MISEGRAGIVRLLAQVSLDGWLVLGEWLCEHWGNHFLCKGHLTLSSS